MPDPIDLGMPAMTVENFDGERVRFWILITFLVICAAGGGGSRTDIVSLIYVRPAAVICLGLLLALPGRLEWRGLRPLLLLLSGLAMIILLQLVPLPPDIWLSLPGRGRFAEAAAAAGLPQPWRPLSLTPDLTLSSALDLLPPFVILTGFAGLGEHRRRILLLLIAGIAIASALLGVIQLTGRADGPAFLYRVTHPGSAVGLFANRNHAALLLAISFPLLRLWSAMPANGPDLLRRRRAWIAAGLAFLVGTMILITGSRAGFALGLASLLLTYLLVPRTTGRTEGRPAKWIRRATWGAAVVLAAAAVSLGRALSVERLAMLTEFSGDHRVANFPIMMRIVKDFMPFGSGFGSFDSIFRVYEPDSALRPTYFNHAHNEIIELVVTGGVPALVLAVLFLGWWGRSTWQAVQSAGRRSLATRFVQSAAVVTGLLLLASLVDYPLRTPLMSVIFTIGCAWLGMQPPHATGTMSKHTGRKV